MHWRLVAGRRVVVGCGVSGRRGGGRRRVGRRVVVVVVSGRGSSREAHSGEAASRSSPIRARHRPEVAGRSVGHWRE